jgi:hypothetical protein
MYRNQGSQYGNISHQGAVVIQCTQDRRDIAERIRVKCASEEERAEYHVYNVEGTLDTSAVRIDIHDNVFQIGTTHIPRSAGAAIEVSSFLNGCNVKLNHGEGPEMDETKKNQKISEGIRYVGVAMGATNPNPEEGASQTKTQITVRTQGTTTMFNNGPQSISPGDTLLWDIPTKAQWLANKGKTQRFGRNPTKVPLVILPLRSYTQGFSEAVPDTFRESSGEKLRAKTTYVDNFAYELKFSMAKALIIPYLKAIAVNIGNKQQDIFQLKEGIIAYMDRKNPLCGVRSKSKYVNDFVDMFATDEEFISASAGLVEHFMKAHADVDRRKIGKALSYSKVGSPVDVLLGAS